MRTFLLTVAFAGSLASASNAAQAVPAGNRNIEQPPIPGASVRRTKAGKTSFDLEITEKVRDLLRDDDALVGKI
uniref:DUF1402 family protein n=1 Tax=Rhizobium sp. PDO1-076 TaxID=1125979 RepID=UPI0011465D85